MFEIRNADGAMEMSIGWELAPSSGLKKAADFIAVAHIKNVLMLQNLSQYLLTWHWFCQSSDIVIPKHCT